MLASYYPRVTSLRDVTSGMLEARTAELPPIIVQRCLFIVEENARVPRLARALAKGNHAEIHDLTAESFAGAQDLYDIVSVEMEEMMYAILGAPGIIGARQTGLGLGGSMVAFVHANQTEMFATHVKQKYWALAHIRTTTYTVQGADGASRLKPR